jgi:hypothetical protein
MAVLVALIALAFQAPTGAQKMYKCGKQYQDRPCDDGQQGKVVGNATSGAKSGTVSDLDCSRRGGDALKIAWAREGGATMDKQLSEAGSSEQRKLVQEVYHKRGTAPEIRASIEADCVVEKERAAQAAELARALMNSQGGSSSASGAPSSGATPTSGADAAQRQQQAEADNKARTCANLNSSLQNNASRMRSGGSASTMASLDNERQSIQKAMRDAGC